MAKTWLRPFRFWTVIWSGVCWTYATMNFWGWRQALTGPVHHWNGFSPNHLLTDVVAEFLIGVFLLFISLTCSLALLEK